MSHPSSSSEERWLPTPLDRGTAFHVAGGKDVIYACVLEDRSCTLYASVDEGASWMTEWRLPRGVLVTATAHRADELLVGTAEHGVYVVSRSGWRRLGSGFPDGEVVIALAAHRLTVVAATPSLGVFRSNQDAPWNACSRGLPHGGHRTPLRAIASVRDGFVAAHRLGVHRLHSGTSFWDPAGMSPPELTGLSPGPQSRLVGWDARSVYLSSDAGATWTALASPGLDDQTIRSSMWVDGSVHILADGPDGGTLYELRDGERTLRRTNDGFPRGVVRLARSRTHLLAAVTGRGVWRRRLREGRPGTPHAPFVLEQNTPNPFQSRTRIAFVLSSDGHAVLSVHDTAGRRLLTLLDGRVRRGRHEVEFDASHLPPGFYSCVLTVKGLTQERRMLRIA